MFKLEKDFSENGITLKAGEYSQEKLIKIYGSKETFNFCITCTSLKDALLEVKDKKEEVVEKMDKRVIENKAILDGFENKEEVVFEELTIEDYKKIADEKGIDYHHRIGLEKLKKLIEDSE
jgi:hypothetical protein